MGTSAAKICRWIRRTTRIGIPAFRRARSLHRARRRSRRRSCPRTCCTSISSAATMVRTCSLGRSTNTTPTFGSFRLTSSGSSARRTLLALAPLQLLAQQLEVPALGCLDQTQHLLRLADVNDVSRVNGITVLPVVGDEDIVAAAGSFGMYL